MDSGDTPLRMGKYWALNAGGSYVRVVPVDSQIGVTDGAASFDTGYPPSTFEEEGAGGVPPFGQDTNGALRVITQWLQYTQAGGPIIYDSAFAAAISGYPKGGILVSSDLSKLWISTAENNATDPDDADTRENWNNLLANRPNETITGTSHTYDLDDAGLQIQRSNSGAPMADLLPGNADALSDGTLLYTRNNDATALLVLQPNTGATLDGSANNFIVLGPGQSAEIASAGGGAYTATQKPLRTRLAASTNFFIGPTGSNLFPGLTAARPFLTRQHAWDHLFQNYDLNFFDVVIVIADGTYSDPMGTIGLSGIMIGQNHPNQVTFQGNIAAPQNVVFSPSGNAATWFAQFGGMFTLSGMTIQNGVSYALQAAGTGATIFGGPGLRFGACGGGHAYASFQATIALNNSYTIFGSAGFHLFASELGIVLAGGNITVTMTGTPNFSSAFAIANRMAFVEPQSITFVGTATGKKFIVAQNSVIDTATNDVNTLPGNIAGTTATGGQYS